MECGLLLTRKVANLFPEDIEEPPEVKMKKCISSFLAEMPMMMFGGRCSQCWSVSCRRRQKEFIIESSNSKCLI